MTINYIIEICVAIDIAILGIAYPIIVDKISNIGEKYQSNYLSVLFNKEITQRSIIFNLTNKRIELSVFQMSLYLTIISFLFLIFSFSPLFNWDNVIINNSAKFLVLILTTILTFLFFHLLNKVALYSGKPTSLLKYLINKYNLLKKETIDKPYFLKTINEFTFYAVEKQDDHLQETLLEFYYNEFSNIRKNHVKGTPLIYPSDLYDIVYKLNVQLGHSTNLKLQALEHRAVSGYWLLGEDFEEIKVSQETYNALWRNLNVICEKEKFIKMYWSTAHQYFDFRLNSVEIDYDFEASVNKNQNEITSRLEERNAFKEFHYALGGLLLYKNQYKTLKYIFNYSQSIPPTFVLLPETMTEIFEWFEEFRNEFKSRNNPVDIKFYFPELDNLGNRTQVNYWICCYLTVLFLRQWTLKKFYTFQDFTSSPSLPENVVELNNWLTTVSFFENCLKNVLNNIDLLENLGYKEIIEDKLNEINEFPLNLKRKIIDKIGQEKLKASLSPDKIKNFAVRSNEIISKAFENYNKIFIQLDENEKDEDLRLTVIGGQTLMSKSAFIDNSTPHLNYETFFASQISKNSIMRFIPNSFLIARTRRLLLNKNNIINGLDKLINDEPDIIIIAINADYNLKQILSKYISITQYIPSTEYRIKNLLYVLNKSDLPSIEHRDILRQEKDFNQLKSINKELKIYASVIDINKPGNEKIKERWDNEEFKENSDVQVQITLAFLAIIFWRKERDIVQISLASEFKEQGIQNSIDEIKPITKLFKNKKNT